MPSDYSPIDPWPVFWTSDISTQSAAATGMAVAYATDVLWALTGRRFGFISIKLRPFRNAIRNTPYPAPWLPWPGAQMPPFGATAVGMATDMWYFVNSYPGSGPDGISPNNEVKLTSPVHAVTEAKVDGVVLPTTAYRLDDHRFLMRVDGQMWPQQNNLLKADTEVGTWTITAQFGETVPSSAAVAVGELAGEFLRAVNGEDCRLPRTVTQLARQGVTITMPSIAESFDKGVTGLFLTDLFIKSVNPNKLQQRSRSYSVDTPTMRRTGS